MTCWAINQPTVTGACPSVDSSSAPGHLSPMPCQQTPWGWAFRRSGQHRSNNLTPGLRGVPARLCLLCTGLPSCVLSLKMFFKSTGNKEGNLAARGSSLETGPMHKTLARLPSNRPRFTLQLRSLRPSYKPLKTSAPLWYSRIHTSPWGSHEDFKKKRESRRVSPIFMGY